MRHPISARSLFTAVVRATRNKFNSVKECNEICHKGAFCSLPPVTGPCKTLFQRWFYNVTSQKCNNFLSEERCTQRCICSLPSKVGPCKAAFTRWYFNDDTGCCKKFSYGGCQGYANNFQTKDKCLNTCSANRPQCK